MQEMMYWSVPVEQGCLADILDKNAIVLSWESYIQYIHPNARNLIETDSQCYDYEKEIVPILNAIPDNYDRMEILHNSFCMATANLIREIRKKFHVELDVTIILYVGLCNGAGWVTKLGDKKVIMLGMEKILELNWIDEISMIGLIYHELGHIWHYAGRHTETVIKSPFSKSVWQIYAEGIAMYFEQVLLGRKFYHQDKNGWLYWCEEHKNVLIVNYIRKVEIGESIQDYFGDWCNIDGYSDTGYYLGAEFAWALSEKYNNLKILNLQLNEVWQELKEFALA